MSNPLVPQELYKENQKLHERLLDAEVRAATAEETLRWVRADLTQRLYRDLLDLHAVKALSA